MADLNSEQVVDYLSNLPVIRIGGSHQDPRDKWGVKAAPVAVAAAAGPAAAAAAPVEEKTEFDGRARRRRRQQDQRHQGRPRDHRPRPQRGEGPGRRRPQDRQGRRRQGRRRGDEEEARRSGRQGRAQVVCLLRSTPSRTAQICPCRRALTAGEGWRECRASGRAYQLVVARTVCSRTRVSCVGCSRAR